MSMKYNHPKFQQEAQQWWRGMGITSGQPWFQNLLPPPAPPPPSIPLRPRKFFFFFFFFLAWRLMSIEPFLGKGTV